MSEPEVLSLEEVRAMRAALPTSGRFCSTLSNGSYVSVEVLERLCATVEHYAAEDAKDREDAKKWRTLMTEASRSLRDDPDYQAQVEKARRERKEAQEELRLLRAWEAAHLKWIELQQHPDGTAREAASVAVIDAWGALCLFREAHQ